MVIQTLRIVIICALLAVIPEQQDFLRLLTQSKIQYLHDDDNDDDSDDDNDNDDSDDQDNGNSDDNENGDNDDGDVDNESSTM